jgi:hypothetical protein
MNIDERIQALTERVKLLASSHRQTEREIRALAVEVQQFRYLAEAIILHHEPPEKARY